MRRLFGQRCLLDTNVLVYGLDKASRYFSQASRVLTLCAEGRLLGAVAHQCLLELLHVLTAYQHVPPEEALRDAQAFARHPRIEVLAPTPETLNVFLRLADTSKTARLEVFDLYLAATMRTHGLTRIVTANVRDFVGIADIEVLDLTRLSV